MDNETRVRNILFRMYPVEKQNILSKEAVIKYVIDSLISRDIVHNQHYPEGCRNVLERITLGCVDSNTGVN